MHVEYKKVTWREAAARLNDHQLAPDLRLVLEPFGDEDVLELSIPYGIKLINEGEFAWSELGEYQDWADRYGVPIPVSLVTDKVVELYDIALPAPYSWDGKPFIRRAVPLYLIQPGEFFGLFESFAPVARTGCCCGCIETRGKVGPSG